MNNSFTFLSKDRETNIHAFEWIPEGKPKAILQICHGMCEYMERYDEFARYLANQGFYVVGNDHLGHGHSVKSDEDHGFFHEKFGNEYLLGDINQLRRLTTQKYPNVPYFILGHSMGSFLIRQYISMEGAGLKGAIVMGTGNQSIPVLEAGMNMCKKLASINGWRFRSPLVSAMAFMGYDRKIKDRKTFMDWLTKDEDIVAKYNNDPWCKFTFTVNGYYNLFYSISDAGDPVTTYHVPKELPILVVSGSEDPVGNYGKTVKTVYSDYKQAGIHDVSLKLYEGDRHEILNELDRETVYEDLKNWMISRL